MTSPCVEDLNQTIAANLRELRRTRGITLDDAADATGVSKSMLGQIERGECGLSVATLWKIVNGLKVPFTALMAEAHTKAELVYNKTMTPLESGQEGFRIYPVFPPEPGRDFEILYIEIDPGVEASFAPHDKGTDEFTLVYEGALSLTVGTEQFDVPAGHSIRYGATSTHSYINKSDHIMCLCMIIRYTSAVLE